MERILEAQTALCSTELKVYHLFYLYKEGKDAEKGSYSHSDQKEEEGAESLSVYNVCKNLFHPI